MERITTTHLDRMCDQLNGLVGAEFNVWNKETRKYNVGTYYVQGANGGYRLERVANDLGGTSDITFRGTKREVYEQIKTAVAVLRYNSSDLISGRKDR